METKKPWQSVTLISNLIMAILVFVIPPEMLEGEMKAAVVIVINMIIRAVLTKKGIAL